MFRYECSLLLSVSGLYKQPRIMHGMSTRIVEHKLLSTDYSSEGQNYTQETRIADEQEEDRRGEKEERVE